MSQDDAEKLRRTVVRMADKLVKLSVMNAGFPYVLLYRENVSMIIYLLRRFEEFLEEEVLK